MPISSILSCEITKCLCYLASVNWVFCSLPPNASQVICLPQNQVIMGELCWSGSKTWVPTIIWCLKTNTSLITGQTSCNPLRAQRKKAVSYQHHDCHQLSRNPAQDRWHQTLGERQAGGASSSLPPNKAHLVKEEKALLGSHLLRCKGGPGSTVGTWSSSLVALASF